MFLGDGKNVGYVIGKTQISQRSFNVLAGNGLLRFFFTDVVGLGGDQSDKLNAAFHKQVAGVFRERLAGGGGKDLRDYLLYCRCRLVSYLISPGS